MVLSYIFDYIFQNQYNKINNEKDIDSIHESQSDSIHEKDIDSIHEKDIDSIHESEINSINESQIDSESKIDENECINICVYNFYDTKQDLLTFLRYKKSKLYNKLNKINFVYNKDFIEFNTDIYNYNKYYESKINKIEFDSNFCYYFDELYKDIKYDYKNIKYELETYLRNI